MIILSHRGYWKCTQEKNSMEAIERSFSMGFGIETDIRDYKGKLVISHDIANEKSILLDAVLNTYKKTGADLPLALNIKADGLQFGLKEQIQKYNIQNYFVFDMSIPDGLLYFLDDFSVFTRESEYERPPAFYNKAKGLWLDEFEGHWIKDDIIMKYLSDGMKICIVSPELHGREYMVEWEHYKRLEGSIGNQQLMLCTDYPEEARRFFNE